MPEGDTIHKLCNYLAPRLTGARLESLTLRGGTIPGEGAGRQVNSVFALGKNLFFALDDDLLVRTHLGMYGSWHRYAPGETWQRPQWQASLVLATKDNLYVCFNARDTELIASPSVRERILNSRLGPDLVAGDADLDQVIARARQVPERDALLADVLLDQRVAAGIGNVYKSELLFIHRLPPTCSIAGVDDPILRAVFTTAADLLQRNLGGGKRVTRFEKDGAGRLWVYGRTGQPCLRCDRPIRYRRLGEGMRATYWCEVCQQ